MSTRAAALKEPGVVAILTGKLVNNRLIPNAMEPRAAIGEYDDGHRIGYTLYTTSQNPHVARLVISAFYGLAPEHKLRVIAPDVGGGFGSKIFIYPRRDRLPLGLEEGPACRSSGPRTAPRAFLTDAHGRDHVTNAEWPSTPTTRSSA
jgi:carbon-monoxide dehydrogenase large subunit